MNTRKLANASKLTLKVLSLGFLVTSLSSVVFAEANIFPVSSNEQTLTTLSIDEAKEIAAFSVVEISGMIPDLSEWKDASVELDTTYYDLDGNEAAYAFDIMKSNEYYGFIIISATKDNYPILEFSKGKLPHKISDMTKKSQSAAANYANKNQLKVGKSTPIYKGATFYYTEYELKDSKNAIKKKIIVDDVTSNVISLEAETVPIITDNVETVESGEIEEAWNNLENKMAGNTSSTATTYSHKISNFPSELWYRGCAPTSAAMVLEYWDNHGYPNFPSSSTLIDELANAMGTTSGGNTVTDNIDNGIEKVCRNHGYSYIDAVTENSVTKTKIETEINADRPFTLSMVDGGAGSGYSISYGNHTVACYGYYRSGLTQYDYIHDTWETAEHYILYGNWHWATNTWVRP